MSKKHVHVPPLALADHQMDDHTLEVLQHHLVAAEEDTKNLVESLAKMGFSGHSHDQADNRDSNKRTPVPSFKASIAEPEVLQRNYEALVSRVCKAESAVQTLKLNVLRIQADSDLHSKPKGVSNEKLSSTVENYEKDIKKLQRELTNSRNESKQAQEAKIRAQEEVRCLQDALEVTTSSKSELTVQLENSQAAKQKLNRRLAELQEHLTRETELRTSLEESHQLLLQRVQDMEGSVEAQRSEVQTITTTCASLKEETVQARGLLKEEQQLRTHAEQQITQLLQDREEYRAQIAKTAEERDFLLKEVSRMRSQYTNLITQLDQMKTLVEEKQTNQEQLVKENKNLYESMKNAAAQNAQLISKYEQELETERVNAAQKYQQHERAVQLQEQLQEASRKKAQFQQQCSILEEEMAELKKKKQNQESEHSCQITKLEASCSALKDKLKFMEEEKNRILKDKDSLLDEVNQAVDSMSEEKRRLEQAQETARLEQEALQDANQQLTEENRRLMERMAAVEQQQEAQKQLDTAMAQMMEEKNKLAYDKGRLQNRVDHLQKELEALANSQSDMGQLRKRSAALEAQYTKSQTELNGCKIHLQRLENELKQAHMTGERKETDFDLAIKARDEAVREAKYLREMVEKAEGKDKNKIGGLQKSLSEAKEDNKKLAATMETVMASHAQMQKVVEKVQVELGRKDCQIQQLHNERTKAEAAAVGLQAEVDRLQGRLISLEAIETTEVEPLRKAVEKSKGDNAKLAAMLETTVQANSKLQGVIKKLEDQLEQKGYILQKLQEARDQESSEHKEEIKTYEERLENLREQMSKERDKSYKRANKEVSEVRKQVEDLVNKNGELSRTNTELRHKVSELEYTVREQKTKIGKHKGQIEHLNKIRARQDDTIDKMRAIQEEISKMDESKREYMKKNEEQAKVIDSFLKQIGSLQQELHSLSQMQTDMAEVISQQEQEIQRQRQVNDELRLKYTKSEQQSRHLEDLRRKTEEKLQEANNESLSLSSNLQDAHEWFKAKFDALQTELISSRTTKAELEHENLSYREHLELEKQKAEETAQKAKQMIQESRETINRLANYAEVSQLETSLKLKDLQKQLQTEKDNSWYTKKKYQELKDASLRQTEMLAKELNDLKAHSYLPYDSS